MINIVSAGRKRGKTTLVETITKMLSKNLRLWTIKHISTSFDTTDKDTWRHLNAGAETAIAVTKGEVVTIRKETDASLDNIVKEVPDDVDLVLVEGFKMSTFPKIVSARNSADARETLGLTSNIFAVYLAGPIESREDMIEGVPVLTLEALEARIEQMVVSDIAGKLSGLNCKRCGFPSCEALAEAIFRKETTLKECYILGEHEVNLTIDGRNVNLSRFPEEFIKNTVLGMVKSLKEIDDGKVYHVQLEFNALPTNLNKPSTNHAN